METNGKFSTDLKDWTDSNGRRPKYSYPKRMELKQWIKEASITINRFKDQRKLPKNRRYPDYIKPDNPTTLGSLRYEFRHHHIAASMMRGRTLDQIEMLPNDCFEKLKLPKRRSGRNRIKPNMDFIRSIMEDCRNVEAVCSDS